MQLDSMHCVPCEGGTRPMAAAEARKKLRSIKGWTLKGKKIYKNFTFINFRRAMKFAVAVGELAEREGHHPDILIYFWNNVRLTLSTHALGGLSLNDFILASKVDKIRI